MKAHVVNRQAVHSCSNWHEIRWYNQTEDLPFSSAINKQVVDFSWIIWVICYVPECAWSHEVQRKSDKIVWLDKNVRFELQFRFFFLKLFLIILFYEWPAAHAERAAYNEIIK